MKSPSDDKKVDWLDHYLCGSERSYAGRRSDHQWLLCRYLLRSSACIHLRTGSAQQAWTFGRGTAVGYHLGDHDYVLVRLNWYRTIRKNNLKFRSLSYGSSYVDGPAAFRIPWARNPIPISFASPQLTPILQGLQMIPAIGLFCAMFFLPESPRWLARKDRWDEAHTVLTLVHSKGDPDSPFVRRELAEIREMVEFEKHNSDITYLELLKPHMINRTHIGVFTQIWSQLTGMNVMSKIPSPTTKIFTPTKY